MDTQKSFRALSAVCLQFAGVFALASAAFFAAATQVWQYPKPRLDFASITFTSATIAIAFFYTHQLIERAVRRAEQGKIWLSAFLKLAAVALAFAIFVFVVRFPISDRIVCLREDRADCVAERPKVRMNIPNTARP